MILRLRKQCGEFVELRKQIDKLVCSALPNTAYDKAVSTARNFLAMGVLSVEQIAQGTGLSVEEVAAL